MSQADELLTRIVGAWDANVHVGLCAALDAARAYLNEKPHEPNPDSVHFSVEHADGSVTDYGLKARRIPSPCRRRTGEADER